jgi:hypothetical protein
MNTPAHPPQNLLPGSARSLWPYAIGAYFVLFASVMVAWITFASRQKMDLVRKDYYDEEIRFQKQLDRSNRAQSIRGEVHAIYDSTTQSILVTLPAAHVRQSVAGRIHLYRPSDAKLDRVIPLSIPAEGAQRIPAAILRPGLWKVRVEWTFAGLDYFFDDSVVILHS